MKAFTAIFFISITLTMFTSKETMAMDLTQFQWKNRLLFLFAPDGNNTLLKNLRNQIMAQKAEVEDRDLIVFEVPAQGSSLMNTTPISRRQADSIREHFAVPQTTFTLILIGKDGGIKLRRKDQIDIGEVFELIDSMPMRKNEMRQKRK